MLNCKQMILVTLISLAHAAPATARLKVAATVPDLAAIARAVAGARAEVFSLTLPTQDPHYVDARPHLALRLNRADLLLTVGLSLESGWLPTLVTGARNPRIRRGALGQLDCSTLARLKQVPRSRVDRSMGDVHPGGNPHYLLDPTNAVRVAQGVARRLARLDSGGRAHYQRNAARFSARVEAARKRWAASLRPHRGAPVVPYHRSWVYFIDAMGLQTVAHLEPRPGIPPSASHLLRVIRVMRARKVRLVLQEEYYPTRTARLVAAKAGARLLVMPGGARLRKGQSYVQRMELMVARLTSALGQGRAR